MLQASGVTKHTLPVSRQGDSQLMGKKLPRLVTVAVPPQAAQLQK
jgi:hypothetical protein